jgi:hypothetical protein
VSKGRRGNVVILALVLHGPLAALSAAEAPRPAGAEGEVPRTEDAAKAAQGLMAKLNAAYYSILQTDVEAFDATYTAERDRQSLGKFTLKWDRKSGELDADIEGERDGWVSGFVEAYLHNALGEALLGFIRAGLLDQKTRRRASGRSYAAASAEGFLLDRSELLRAVTSDVTSYTIRVAKDLKHLNVRFSYKRGSTYDYAMSAVEARGKLRIVAVELTEFRPRQPTGSQMCEFEYEERDGVPFVKSLSSLITVGARQTRYDAALERVSFRKGARPTGAEILSDPKAPEPPRPSNDE